MEEPEQAASSRRTNTCRPSATPREKSILPCDPRPCVSGAHPVDVLPLIWVFRSETLLFCSPLCPVFFPPSSVFRVEASNSVTFLCGLCVFVPECVYCTARALTNLTTQKPRDFTIAAWRYLDSGGEASLSPGAPSAKGFGVQQLGSS
ncbi:hypothetical protein JOQ06_029033, partial [Pogonophryne albipinna]